MKNLKVPTIGQLLDAMPPEGVTTVNDRLLAYATLGYHHDAVDRRVGYSVRKIKAFVQHLDAYTEQAIGTYTATQIDDEDSDLFGVHIAFDAGTEILLQFRSPSLKDMPKPNSNQGVFLKGAIKQLALDPETVLDQPYLLFPVVSEALGRALGFL